MGTYKIGNGREVNLIMNDDGSTMRLDPSTSEKDRIAFIKVFNEVQKQHGFPVLPEDWGKDIISNK